VISGPHILYRCFDADGELLYIGITNDPGNRFNLHASATPWWPDVAEIKLDESFASRWELEVAERDAILAEIPLHNSQHNDRWHTKHKPQPPTPEMREALEKLAALLGLSERSEQIA
jgi:hypothetical protein